jgi:glycosyltransferase involved in cell wall biosynthesis
MMNDNSAIEAEGGVVSAEGAAVIGRVPVSVCIVAHNEEAMIADAIASVTGWAEEIIVLDCESRDATAEIARSLGAVVHPHPNILPEMSKNHSFEYAASEWIFSLDADEVLPEALKREIAETLARNPAEIGFKTPRRNFYFGAPLMHGGAYPNRQLRLFRRGRGRYPGLGVHERLMIEGAIGELREPFDHHPYPTFEMWMRKLDFYTVAGADELAERNVPITPRSIRHHMVTRPLRRWIERLFLKGGIRDGVPGVVAASSDLITIVMSFARYWMRVRGR